MSSINNKGVKSGGGLQELKQRLLFVLLGIIIFRIGTHIPVPGLDPARLADLFNSQKNGILGLEYCATLAYEKMVMTFTLPGCETATYETNLSSGFDINAPGDGKNIVLNAVLKCPTR